MDIQRQDRGAGVQVAPAGAPTRRVGSIKARVAQSALVSMGLFDTTSTTIHIPRFDAPRFWYVKQIVIAWLAGLVPC
jgi:hypothetical protein